MKTLISNLSVAHPSADSRPVADHILAAARTACSRIAPLWPLKNFVAVNPFLGVTQMPFPKACALYSELLPGGMQMPPSYYRTKLDSGEITSTDIAAALTTHASSLSEDARAQFLNPATLRNALETLEDHPTSSEPPTCEQAVIEWISHFCAAYFDAGQSTWRFPWRHLSVFAAWRAYAELDTAPERYGIKGFRDWLRRQPTEPAELLAECVPDLGIEPDQWDTAFHGLLLSVRGWAGHIRYREWESGLQGKSDQRLLELLAIRVAYESGIRKLTGTSAWQLKPPTTADSHKTDVLYLMQLAEEHAWQTRLFNALRSHTAPLAKTRADRPAVQAVFCIDVRSEPFRRALESVSSWIETHGFAGFFGVALEYLPFGLRTGTARCPVLLKPAYKVREGIAGGSADAEETRLHEKRLGRRISHAWNAFRTSAISCFSFVETAGLAYGLDLLHAGFVGRADSDLRPVGTEPLLARHEGVHGGAGISLADRVHIARGFLKNLGWNTRFARLILLCGHGSGTVNNPYGSGLDCGACGGHAGDANARVCAAILNDPDVRKTLASEGVQIPLDTWFLAGLHNTTTDDVTLLDTQRLPPTHKEDLIRLAAWLQQAGTITRRERAPRLGLDTKAKSLDKKIRARSKDWSQVRPEWGLAGNAAFVAAPRLRSFGKDLGGRVFLHDYEWTKDTDNTVLELVLTAPMVVASWINLQYYGSTVNPACFGSGNKVLHNVVGTFGVCLGNGGDLQPGLPLQSVHDGTRWMHDPVRLHVVIEAPRTRIDSVLQKHTGVRDLVENEWLLLFSLDSDTGTLHRREKENRWVSVGCVAG